MINREFKKEEVRSLKNDLIKEELKPLKNDLMKEELTLLREEMRELKECQTKYVSLAVTASGAIFAYLIPNLVEMFNFNVNSASSSVEVPFHINPIFLVPLIIIFPISCIFFNKATTLYRIVGYYQVLESFHIYPYNRHFIGWENSMRLFREEEGKREYQIKQELNKKGERKIERWEKLSLKNKANYFLTVFGLNILSSPHTIKLIRYTKRSKHLKSVTELIFGLDLESLEQALTNPLKRSKLLYYCNSQSYWKLVYSIFFLIAVLCFFLTIMPVFIHYDQHNLTLHEIININKFNIILTLIFFNISFFVFRYNLKVLHQLEHGFYSYEANYIFWKALLTLPKKEWKDNEVDEYNLNSCTNHHSIIIWLFFALNVIAIYYIMFSKV